VFFMAIGVYAVFPRICWREEHICVDIIDLVYPKRWIAPRQMALNALAALFMALVTWRMWFLAGRLTEDGEVTMFLRLPKGPLVYFFVLMCGAATLALAANAVRYALGRGPLTPQ
jgi:TRAP-type C4-dicarboxylate transport system permease small subunit